VLCAAEVAASYNLRKTFKEKTEEYFIEVRF
jgi:hypothetical protein